MKSRSKVTKQEVEQIDLNKFSKGIEELKSLDVNIDLDQKKKELLEAFDERERINSSMEKSNARAKNILLTLRKNREDLRNSVLMARKDNVIH
jgi:hypothetical protein